jgi:hypothetical protein
MLATDNRSFLIGFQIFVQGIDSVVRSEEVIVTMRELESMQFAQESRRYMTVAPKGGRALEGQ